MSQSLLKKFKPDNEVWAGVALSAAAAFMLCFFEPLCIYFQNKKDYIFDLYDLFPVLSGMFGCMLAALIAITLLLKKTIEKLYFPYITVFFAGFLCLYIQGNYLVKELPLLNGMYIDWSLYRRQYIQSGILWTAVFLLTALAAFLLKKDRMLSVIKWAGIFFILIFIFTAAATGVMNDGFERKLNLINTSHTVLDYSSDTNFIMLVVDCTDAEYERIVLDKYPEYKEAFKDFTYFDNAVGSYICTEYALPHIVGGERFTFQRDFDEYERDMYLNSPFIEKLESDGYRLGAYSDHAPLTSFDMKKYENIIDGKGKLTEPVAFAKVWLRMVFYKYAPYFVKRYTQVEPGEFSKYFKIQEGIRRWDFEYSNIPFYAECTNLSMNTGSDKWFKLIHISGAHAPFQFLPDMTETNISSYEDNVAAANTIMKAYVERLKADGIYDNSVIIMLADHGIAGDMLTSHQGREDPILFVKGIGERHDEMRTSEAPISYEDLYEAFYRLYDGAYAEEAFDAREGDIRTRRILLGEGDPLTEYATESANSDREGFHKTGNVYGK